MFKKRFLVFFSMVTFAACGFGTTKADVITWSSTDLFAGGDNDAFIDNSFGTSVLAVNGTHTSNTTTSVANGVTFQNLAGNNNPATGPVSSTQNGVTLTTAGNSTGNLNSFGGGDFTPANAANVIGLVEGAIFNVESITFSGLTVNDSYQVQILANDSRNRDNGWDIGFNAGNTATTVAIVGDLNTAAHNNGDSFIGTWVATSSTQTITMTATRTGNISVGDSISVVPNGGQRQINAVQLRTIPVPEPGTAAVGLLGLAGMFMRRRRA